MCLKLISDTRLFYISGEGGVVQALFETNDSAGFQSSLFHIPSAVTAG